MESQPEPPADPRADLALADAASRRLSDGLRLPAGLHSALATAIAVQIGTAAYGISRQSVTGLVVGVLGVVVFGLVAVASLAAFRRINGVRVDGLAGQIVLGTGVTASTAYLAGFAAATWAAFESQWWVTVLAAAAGGVGYAYGTARWWRAYRQDPSAHARGTSPATLAALAVLATLGLAVLIVQS